MGTLYSYSEYCSCRCTNCKLVYSRYEHGTSIVNRLKSGFKCLCNYIFISAEFANDNNDNKQKTASSRMRNVANQECDHSF